VLFLHITKLPGTLIGPIPPRGVFFVADVLNRPVWLKKAIKAYSVGGLISKITI